MNIQESNVTTQKAVDIQAAGTDITKEMADSLRSDENLRRELQALHDLQAAVRTEHAHVNVEQRLSQFHQRHRKARTVSLRPWLWAAVAAAAVVIGFLFIPHSTPSAETSLKSEALFVADAQQSGISLTNEAGERITLSPATSQSSAITLADFRKVMPDAENTERVTLNVPYGKSADITLPDGSVACLHPGSRVIFPTTFTGKERRVWLEGQAYFKVAHDTEHPFIVVTERLETTVLGTEFDIDSHLSEVTLIKGSVSVSADTESKTLTPGQQATFDAQHSAFSVKTVDIQSYEAWRDGYLYYDNVELQQIMEAIGKNFNMTVEFRNREALHLKMRFMAERNKGVEPAIEMMNRMKKATVRIEDGRLVVY